MLQSSFMDSHKGRKFVVRFFGHQNGFTIRVEIAGLPPIEDSDNIWAEREEAKAAGVKAARDIIDGMQ